jgi:hypothetical protein
MFKAMKNVYGCDIDRQKSVINNGTYKVYVEGVVEVIEKKEEEHTPIQEDIVEGLETNETPIITLEVAEVSYVEVGEDVLIQEETSIQEDDEKYPSNVSDLSIYNKEYALSLFNEKDKAAGKELLAEYAFSLGCNISIKKNKTFQKMMEELESAFG